MKNSRRIIRLNYKDIEDKIQFLIRFVVYLTKTVLEGSPLFLPIFLEYLGLQVIQCRAVATQR